MARLDPEIHLMLALKEFYRDKPVEYAALPPNQKLEDPVNISFQYTGNPEDILIEGLSTESQCGPVIYTRVSLNTLEVLAQHPAVVTIERQTKKNLLLNKSIPGIHVDQVRSLGGTQFSGYTGKGTIVGIIDTGIDFRHGAFKKGADTRILKIWDQTLQPQSGEASPAAFTDTAIGNVTFGYGVEYTEAQINNVLHNVAFTSVRHIDEYGHGTHVAGIAAGNGSQPGVCDNGYKYIGVAPEADIIVVRKMGLTDGDKTGQLPAHTDTMMDGIRYIMMEAKKRNKAVAINMSFGKFTEIMDGTGDDSVAMNELLKKNPRSVAFVLAAGNEANDRLHVHSDWTLSGFSTFNYVIKPGDNKSRFITIIKKGNIDIEVVSTLPNPAKALTKLMAGGLTTVNTEANGPGGRVTITQTNNRIWVQIDHPENGVNLAGEWNITITSNDGLPGSFDAFCTGINTIDKTTPSFGDWVSEKNTLDEDATAEEPIAVGSFNVATNWLSRFSSRGKTLDGRVKPDICAPGEGIISSSSNNDKTDGGYNNCCCGCCQDAYHVMSGTSMATPHVAGAIALLFQKNKELGYKEVKAALINTATPYVPPPEIDEYDSRVEGWGAGSINVKAAIDSIPASALPGGGGGSNNLVAAHYKAPVPQPVNELQEKFMQTRQGKRLQGLFHPYFLEIRKLINTNKKVATVWHRNKGSEWLQAAFRYASQPSAPVSLQLNGLSLPECVSRLVEILKKYCTPSLAKELSWCGRELSSLKEGLNLYQLVELLDRPIVAQHELQTF